MGGTKMKRLLFVIVIIFLAFAVSCATNSNTGQAKKAATKSMLHKCVYTYIVNGQQHTFTTCAPSCPVHPDWTDLGPPCP